MHSGQQEVHVLTLTFRHFVSLRKSIIAFLYLRFICFYALNTLFGKHNIKVTEALNFFHPSSPYEGDVRRGCSRYR
jgi:uncharacterized membrane protein